MLTYTEFSKIIQVLKANNERLRDIIAVTGWGDIYDLSLEHIVVQLLTKIFRDVDRWFEYWIYEQNYGEDWMQMSVLKTDGTPIMLQTDKQLYNFLIKNMKENA